MALRDSKTDTKNMHANDSQKAVSDQIFEQQAQGMRVRLTENGWGIIIEIGEHEAAYTAEEAREQAHAIEGAAAQRGWNMEVGPIVDYIRDLSAVLDAPQHRTDAVAENVAEKWAGEDIIEEND